MKIAASFACADQFPPGRVLRRPAIACEFIAAAVYAWEERGVLFGNQLALC